MKAEPVAAVAAIDVGTVSTGLLITDGATRRRHRIDTGLGTGRLTPVGKVLPTPVTTDALEGLARTLGRYRGLVEGCVAVSAVATAGARLATNRAELEGLVHDVLGTELRLLDGDREAELAFRGAISDPEILLGPDRDPTTPVLTIDIGGASTELALGTVDRPQAVCSLPVGARLLTGAYLESDPPRPEELSAALSVVELHVEDARRHLPGLDQAVASGVVVGTGGIATVAAVEIGIDEDPSGDGPGDGPLHGVELGRDGVEEVFRTLATENRADRAHNPGLPPSRVDDIVGGCALLVEMMRQLALGGLVVSQRGLLDGVAADLLVAQGLG